MSIVGQLGGSTFNIPNQKIGQGRLHFYAFTIPKVRARGKMNVYWLLKFHWQKDKEKKSQMDMYKLKGCMEVQFYHLPGKMKI